MSDSSCQDKFAETSFWDQVANQRVYAAFDDDEYNAIIDRCLGDDLTGKTIVDIGSASGVSAALFAARGAKVIGIDISPDLISQAQGLWEEYKERMEFMVGDAENLDLPDESADAVFFGGVLHHFPHRDKVYSEALRILKPGGRFIAVEPNKLDVFELIEWSVADLRGKLAPSEFPIDPLEMCNDLIERGMKDVVYWTIRNDIPVLNQLPLIKKFFSREKGFSIKRPILRFVNAFRAPEARGTFFIINAVKP